MLEWRIQDFRRGGGASPHGGRRDTNLLNVLENCMKSRKIWPLGGGGTGGVPPRSANVLCSENFDYVVVVILSEGIDVCNVEGNFKTISLMTYATVTLKHQNIAQNTQKNLK